MISIHALREEGDIVESTRHGNAVDISIHALREEGDGSLAVVLHTGDRFLSTPSARRATYDVQVPNIGEVISIHALREEGDAHVGRGHSRVNQFLSTPSARRATLRR